MANPRSKDTKKKEKNIVSGSEINAGENIHIGDIIHQHFPEKSPAGTAPRSPNGGRLLVWIVAILGLGIASYFIWQNTKSLETPSTTLELLPKNEGDKPNEVVVRNPGSSEVLGRNGNKSIKLDQGNLESAALMPENTQDVKLDIFAEMKKDTVNIKGTNNIKPFSIGRHEVTIGQYWAFCKMTENPFPFKSVDTLMVNYPMCYVSWYEADTYCKYFGGRLPSLQEWTLVALSITGPDSTMTESEKSGISWNNDNSQSVPHPVGKKMALNHVNIYDIFGNVDEWCADGPTVEYKYTVGGYFKSYPVTLDLKRKPVFTRAAAKSNVTGFRVVY